MLRLAICDDDGLAREHIRNICESEMTKWLDECEIVEFEDGRSFYVYPNKVDLLILDIEMPDMTGLELKNRLQSARSNTVILFVTDHDELSLSAYGVNVYGFVKKEQMEIQLPEALAGALRLICQYVLLEGGIDSRDIVYVEAENIYCNVHLADGSKHLIRSSLNHLEEELLPAKFIRVHKTYLVNPYFIDKVKENEVFIRGGKVFPISVRNRKEVRKKYRDYCEEQMRWC